MRKQTFTLVSILIALSMLLAACGNAGAATSSLPRPAVLLPRIN